MKPYRFLHPQTKADPIGKAETVVLFGDANNPEVVASKKRLELIGRTVEIQPEAGQPLGLCGQPCTCTELCKSMKYENI